MPFFQISLEKSELKTSHNTTFRDCRLHFSDNLSRNRCILVMTTLFPYSPLCGWPPTTRTTRFHVFQALSARFKMERRKKAPQSPGPEGPGGIKS